MFSVPWLPRVVGIPVLCLLRAVTAVDVVATVKGVMKMNRHLEEIDALAARIREASDDMGQSLAERVLDLSEKGQELKQTLEEKRADMREDLEDWKEERSEDLEELRLKLEKLLSSRDKLERRLMRAFPKMRSQRYKDALERWKRSFDPRK